MAREEGKKGCRKERWKPGLSPSFKCLTSPGASGDTFPFLHLLCLNDHLSLTALVAHFFPIPSSNRFSLISSFLTHFLKIHRPVSVVWATEARLWTLPSCSTSCHLSPAARQGRNFSAAPAVSWRPLHSAATVPAVPALSPDPSMQNESPFWFLS